FAIGIRAALPVEMRRPGAKKHSPRAKSQPAADPAFQKWMQHVALLPAEDQVAEVVAKLKELNRRYDGNEDHRIMNGVVFDLIIVVDEVTDVSPVRALRSLQKINLSSPRGGSKLADLSPLAGLPLTSVICAGTAVDDLSPLKGMSLKYLEL